MCCSPSTLGRYTFLTLFLGLGTTISSNIYLCRVPLSMQAIRNFGRWKAAIVEVGWVRKCVEGQQAVSEEPYMPASILGEVVKPCFANMHHFVSTSDFTCAKIFHLS